jgi:Xaa-Pro aminopeptidase
MAEIERQVDQSILSFHKEVRFPRFPHTEFDQRLAKAKELMGGYGVDALLLFAPENLYYYTGFKKENFAVEKRWRRGAIILKDADPVMLMGNEVFFNATLTSWVENIKGWGGPPELNRPQNFVEAYVQLIQDLDLHRKVLGMEMWEDSPAIQVDLTYLEFDQLRKALPDARIVDAGELIWEQRMVKTPWEIEIIRELASITTKGFIAGLEAVREGITERDIVRNMYRIMIDSGLNNEPMVSRIPLKGPGHYHAAIMGPHDTVLRKGDMLQFDGGPCHKGYWSDVQRNACVGEPPALEIKLYDMALEAQQTAINAVKPGVTAADIHRVATEKLMSIDPSIDINRCVFVGHGLGLHTHEPPYLVPNAKEADIILKEGMYLAIEVSAFDAPEFRVIGGFPEDNILVTKDGYENLTKAIPNHLWIG